VRACACAVSAAARVTRHARRAKLRDVCVRACRQRAAHERIQPHQPVAHELLRRQALRGRVVRGRHGEQARRRWRPLVRGLGRSALRVWWRSAMLTACRPAHACCNSPFGRAFVLSLSEFAFGPAQGVF
jgi:hypothetical protein